MLFSTLSLSNRGSHNRITEAKSLLFEQISKLKKYNNMANIDELNKLVDELTSDDQKQFEQYKTEIEEAKEDLLYHQKKIKYYTALIKQREEFVKQIDSKLGKAERLKDRLANTLS